MPTRRLDLDSSPEHLFGTELDKALTKLGIDVTDETRVYVTGLLVSVLEHRDDAPDGGDPLERYLAPDLLRSEKAGLAARARLLRGVGDSALLLCGYWWQLLEYGRRRRGGDYAYHCTVGTIAYRALSFHRPGGRPGALYTELAERFRPLADALSRVSARLQVRDPGTLLKLYARYLETHSDRLALILSAQGIDLSGRTH